MILFILLMLASVLFGIVWGIIWLIIKLVFKLLGWIFLQWLTLMFTIAHVTHDVGQHYIAQCLHKISQK